MAKRVDYALRYAAQGYRVMPAFVIKDQETGVQKKVSAAKTVLIKPCSAHAKRIGSKDAADCRKCTGGHAGATTDPRYIRWMWEKRPTALVAVVPPPGVVILDDDSHVWDEVWAKRPRVRSVSDKHHYWFRLAPDQEQLTSENGILYAEPDGVVDLRATEGGLWIMAPCGQGLKGYRPENGWASDPARLPVLPSAVYERLRQAPRKAGEGGGGGPLGRFAPGVREARVGGSYDRDPDVCEEILARHGWTCDGGDGWVRPGGSQVNARLTETGGVWFFNVFTTSDEHLRADHYYTASMLRCALDFGGRWKPTYFALLSEGAFKNANQNNTDEAKEAFSE